MADVRAASKYSAFISFPIFVDMNPNDPAVEDYHRISCGEFRGFRGAAVAAAVHCGSPRCSRMLADARGCSGMLGGYL